MGEENREEPEVEMIQCPACDLMLPKDDLNAQVAHMEANHQDVHCVPA